MDYSIEEGLAGFEEQCLAICKSAFKEYPYTHIETVVVLAEPSVAILELHLEVESGRDFNIPVQTYTIVTFSVNGLYTNAYGSFHRDGFYMDFTIDKLEYLDVLTWNIEFSKEGWVV